MEPLIERNISWNNNVQTFRSSVESSAVEEEVFDEATLEKDFLDTGAYSSSDFKRDKRDELLSGPNAIQNDETAAIAMAAVAASDVINDGSCPSLEVGDLISNQFVMLKYKQAGYQCEGENTETEIKSNENSKTEDGAWDCSGTFEYYHEEEPENPVSNRPRLPRRSSAKDFQTLQTLREVSESMLSHAPQDFAELANASEGSLDIDFSRGNFNESSASKKPTSSNQATRHASNSRVFERYSDKAKREALKRSDAKRAEKGESSISSLTGCEIHVSSRHGAREVDKNEVTEDSMSTLGCYKEASVEDSFSSLKVVMQESIPVVDAPHFQESRYTRSKREEISLSLKKNEVYPLQKHRSKKEKPREIVEVNMSSTMSRGKEAGDVHDKSLHHLSDRDTTWGARISKVDKNAVSNRPPLPRRSSAKDFQTLQTLREVSESMLSHAPQDFAELANASEGSLDIDFSRGNFNESSASKKPTSSNQATRHASNSRVFERYSDKAKREALKRSDAKRAEKGESSISSLTGCEIHVSSRHGAREVDKNEVTEDSMSTLGCYKEASVEDSFSSLKVVMQESIPVVDAPHFQESRYTRSKREEISLSLKKNEVYPLQKHRSKKEKPREIVEVNMSSTMSRGKEAGDVHDKSLHHLSDRDTTWGARISQEKSVTSQRISRERPEAGRAKWQKKYSTSKKGGGFSESCPPFDTPVPAHQHPKKNTMTPGHSLDPHQTMIRDQSSQAPIRPQNRRSSLQIDDRSLRKNKNTFSVPTKRSTSINIPALPFHASNAGNRLDLKDGSTNTATMQEAGIITEQEREKYAKKMTAILYGNM